MRTGRPQLTAGHGGPVCQPWRGGDGDEEQRLEAMPFAGFFAGNSKKVRSIRMNLKFGINLE
ncbi:hypothetical protein DPPLL_05550 [Desulfofustis limnaeus]|uniref:Uncharacterized protein n=1 Tax=Desulfofustis limnaeus TaxID=2740163 RepID=A0ABN6M2V2_9BACT|nr:hypothetical protein DPPLL_05550 [Desulfofustis limnaeus]